VVTAVICFSKVTQQKRLSHPVAIYDTS